jgi:PAS domain S-box-containing protein
MAESSRAQLVRRNHDEVPAEPIGDAARRQMIDDAGVGLYETALDGAFRYVNRSLVTILGYPSPAAFLAERPLAGDFYADPVDQARSRETIRREGKARGLVFAARSRDGSPLWLSENASPLRDGTGRITGYVGSISDVTELIAARDRIAATEASYRSVFERLTEGIYRSTLSGQMLGANPALARLNGYDSVEELLTGVKDIAREWYVDPERRNEFKRLMETEGAVENLESEIYRHKTRERIWISENSYLVRDAAGRPLYYEGSVRDITPRKTAEAAALKALEAAEASSRAKSRFLAHMSHELRTPLNAILGFSDLLRCLDLSRISPDRVRDYADDIHKSGRHLLDLINDVLDLARIENDAMPLKPEPVGPQDAVDEALAILRPLAAAKAIEVVRDLRPTGRVLADRRALHQCLLNVLSNAVKFSPAGTEIRVSVSAAGGMVAFAVADQGPGIAPEQIARIGEPFNTAETPNRTATAGTGLGLAITRALIERMGGGFAVASTLGVGTCVTLSLPHQR